MDRQSVFTVVLPHIVQCWLPMMEVRKSARTWHDKGQQFMISCLARPYFLLHIGSTTNSSAKLLSHFQRTTGQISDSTVWVVMSKLEKRKYCVSFAKKEFGGMEMKCPSWPYSSLITELTVQFWFESERLRAWFDVKTQQKCFQCSFKLNHELGPHLVLLMVPYSLSCCFPLEAKHSWLINSAWSCVIAANLWQLSWVPQIRSIKMCTSGG